MQKTPDDDSDQVTWSCIPSLNSGVNMDNPIEYPPFVIRIVEVRILFIYKLYNCD